MSLRGWAINEFLATMQLGKTAEEAFNVVVRDERQPQNLDLHNKLLYPPVTTVHVHLNIKDIL